MIEIDKKTYSEKLKLTYEYHIHHHDDDIVDKSILHIYNKTIIHHPTTKSLIIHPVLNIDIKGQSKLYSILKKYFDNDSYNNYKFDIKDIDKDTIYHNCYITLLTNYKSDNYLIEMRCDYIAANNNEDIKYLGRFEIPLNLNDNYIEYIKNHEESRFCI